jgi:predicted dehydrogenase
MAREHAAVRTIPDQRPRLGFVGVGWIGNRRLQSLAGSAVADVALIYDAAPDLAQQAVRSIQRENPGARASSSFEALLDDAPDGIVIATPNALHAEQAIAALSRGIAVFCQKPLARTAAEVARIVETARTRDRLLAVDFCYRTVAGVPQIKELVASGALGEVFAVDLVFHNAYGPDKPWFYDREQSGGGCVMDLGIHLIDLLLWVLESTPVQTVGSHLYAGGRRLPRSPQSLEDYATAQIDLTQGAIARLACSWRLSAGCDAVIEASFYGTRGALRFHNVNGSFYDFTVEHYEGTQKKVLSTPPDDWGGRAICAWAQRLARAPGFDREAERLTTVAEVVDAIYGQAS